MRWTGIVGGPQCDVLGRAGSGEAVLVEAKTHVPELLSSPTQATASSAEMIGRAAAPAAGCHRAAPPVGRTDSSPRGAARSPSRWLPAQSAARGPRPAGPPVAEPVRP